MRDLVGLRALGALGCVVVALGALLGAWLSDPLPLEADDARAVAQEALEEIGLRDVEVAEQVDRRTHEPAAGGAPVETWRTVSTVEGGTVELWVAMVDGAAVYLLDRNVDATAQLLTDEQFEALREVSIRPPADEHRRRNVAATVAAVLIVGVGLGLAAHERSAARSARPVAR
jgi:hypothetical protein